jgi:hypothetical protein
MSRNTPSTLILGIGNLLWAEQTEIGRFQVCLLFSPRHEFSDQGVAVAPAKQVINQAISINTLSQAWRGEATVMSDRDIETTGSLEPLVLSDRLRQLLSRCELLHGALPRGGDQ